MGYSLALRTLRNQSGSNGNRTLGSILAGGASGGAGSSRRMYGWYMKNHTTSQFYDAVFGIRYGEFRNRAEFLLGNP